MKQVLLTDKETINGLIIGYYAIDLNTKELLFFSQYDLNHNLLEKTLIEINVKKERDILCNLLGTEPSFFVNESLPNQIKKILIYTKDKHLDYCQKNNFTIENILNNYENITLTFKMLNIDKAKYNALKNTIEIDCNLKEFNSQKEILLSFMLLHELGHAKVTDYTVDDSNNGLIINLGYVTNIVFELIPLCTLNNTLIYKPKLIQDAKKELYALEEIANDIECMNIIPEYSQSEYLKFAQILNKICGHELIKARYSHNVEVFYKALNNIIPSEYLASELLDLLAHSLYESEDIKNVSTEKSLELLRKYNEFKNKIL